MPTTADNQNTMEFLLDVPVKLTVELGNCEMTMKDLLQVGIGSVVQLDKSSSDPIVISQLPNSTVNLTGTSNKNSIVF